MVLAVWILGLVVFHTIYWSCNFGFTLASFSRCACHLRNGGVVVLRLLGDWTLLYGGYSGMDLDCSSQGEVQVSLA